jgi:trehalose 6-phosphate synthase/phosphatase
VRTLFVSNRLPIVAERSDAGWTSHTSAGGLVTALAPVLRRFGGMWIGWTGSSALQGRDLKSLIAEFARREGYRVAPVPLTTEDYERFYQGFCNEIIWPLFHDLQTRCNFMPEYWTSAQKVSQAFADVVQKHARADDLIWVQDYHLLGLGRVLRERGIKNPLAFFLHIPFPSPDIFCKLPWRLEVLRGLLNYQVIGLQTRRDLENFSDCVHRLIPECERSKSLTQLKLADNSHACMVGSFPIGIDFEEFGIAADTPAVEQRIEELRKEFGGRQIILGLDRLDYTKGIPYRLKAFGLALERYPELHKQVTLLQVVVPSRENVPEYQKLKGEIEQLVAAINGKYTQPGWVPIHHIFRNIERQELLAWYRMSDVALVTPLKDGMNLVAKEYCACQIEGNGVLVLSEFAGAAEQMGQWAVPVNPYDVEGVAAAIRKAVTMTPEERRPAMDRLRASTREENVYWWLDQFIAQCGVTLRKEEQPLLEGLEA